MSEQAGVPVEALPDPEVEEVPLILEDFFPYRVSLFYASVSLSLARRYSDEFDLTVPEWRVMAALGQKQPQTANELCVKTSMDKVQVSRAVARLHKGGHLTRRTDRSDRRRTLLRLTDKGRETYAGIVPLARDYEQSLLAVLTPEERAEMERLMVKIKRRAKELAV